MSDDDIDDLLADLAEFDDDYEPDPGIGEAGEEYEEEDDLSDFDDDEDEFVELVPSPEVAAAIERAEAKIKPEQYALDSDRRGKQNAGLIVVPATKTSEAIRRTLMSGHCAAPQSRNPEESHKRCKGYSRANPDKIFQPCPDKCHYPEERYECEGCGGTLAEAPHYPLDEDGDVRFVHFDDARGRALDPLCR